MLAYVSLERARGASRWVGMPHEAITTVLQRRNSDEIRSALASHIERSFEQFLHPREEESEPDGRKRQPQAPQVRA